MVEEIICVKCQQPVLDCQENNCTPPKSEFEPFVKIDTIDNSGSLDLMFAYWFTPNPPKPLVFEGQGHRYDEIKPIVDEINKQGKMHFSATDIVKYTNTVRSELGLDNNNNETVEER